MKRLEIAIGGRVYPLKVEDEEASMVLETVDELTQKLRSLQATYSNQDMQDCLSMTLLTYAVELKKLKRKSDSPDLESRLASIDALLDKHIS